MTKPLTEQQRHERLTVAFEALVSAARHDEKSIPVLAPSVFRLAKSLRKYQEAHSIRSLHGVSHG